MKTIISLFLCAVSIGFAAQHAVETNVKGQGATRDLAIQNALYQAVSQVQGVRVDSTMAPIRIDTTHIDIDRDPNTSSKTAVGGPLSSAVSEVNGLITGVDSVEITTQTMGPLTLTEARGLIKSYEVVEEKQLSDAVYEVTLKVWVYDYQSPEDTRKVRVAIFPFDSTSAAHQFGDVTVSGQQLGAQFSQVLNSMLGRNPKFTLLDRDTQAAILKEKQILISNDAPIEEKVRLGEVLGTDYMVVGTIQQAEIVVTEKTSPIIGAKMRRFKAYMDVEYRVIVGPTRQVVSADQLRIKLEDDQVKALAEKWESDDIDYTELQNRLVALAASDIADLVSDTLYPIRVAAVQQDGTLIVNQGGNRFIEGDVIEVYQIEGDVIDPETGVSLGKEQVQLAAAKITKVLPRFSYAALMQGTVSDKLLGGVCRRVKPDFRLPPAPARPTNIQETESGGVKMPFDDRKPSQLIRDK
jgi:curli biogenesis system outer membrane secretion channel CsgG